jgi:hypothetical protein
MPPGLHKDEDPEPPLLCLGQAGERLVHAGQVPRPSVDRGQQHPDQQGADRQLPGPDPDR